MSVEAGRFYSKMFDFRQKSDYGDFVEFEEEKVREWLETAERFMKEIEGVIERGCKINRGGYSHGCCRQPVL